LIVKGKGIRKYKFTLHDLMTKFPRHEVVTTLQCAGNRREDLHDDNHEIFIAPHWVVGAMSTAKWGGIKIRDVLKHCGMDVDAMALGVTAEGDAKHLQFEGYDSDETGVCYGGSIPIDKAVDGLGDAILAFEMNVSWHKFNQLVK
jgi:sulfite oxidase